MIYWICAFFPLFVFVAFVAAMHFLRSRDRKRWAPASRDRLLRPAGESLRLEIETLDEAINDALTGTGFYIFIPLCVSALAISLDDGLVRWLVVVVMAMAGSVLTIRECFKALELMNRRRRYKLGFDGERLVGEHLTELMLDGYRVFHDVPFDGFNVDHVVVGPAGVFGIETKTRRKRKDLKNSHKVIFDGTKLHWPDGSVNDFGVGNARDRARQLQLWLSSAVGEAVKVTPVLTFPGWLVETRRLGDVRVLNPKTIRRYLEGELKRQDPLPEQRIRQIVHQLTEKVRLPE